MSKGAIAAGNSYTLESAEEVLKAGGNAFDAAISASFTMFAAEPCMASAGAGGFAMCHTADGDTRLLDFFTQTPIHKDLERNLDFPAIEVDFGTEQEIFHVGKASVAVPGVVAGLFEIHRKYGTMPMTELVQHAKAVAKDGNVIGDFGELDMALLQDIFKRDPIVSDIFFNDGIVKKKGDLIKYPHLPDFLDFLSSEGDKGFYHGEIGQKVSRDIYEGGGFLQRSDFENYRVLWSEPMRMPYRGKTLCLPNGPSMGGAILALLDHHGMRGDMTLAQVLLQVKEELHERGDLEKAMKMFLPDLDYRPLGKGIATKGTSHFSIVDEAGNSIALTMSIGEGSGYFIPGTDMQMNNMLGETFLLPGGHHSWAQNCRLNSMMTPVMLIDDDAEIHYAGGSGGAGRIPYVIYQVLEALYGKRLPLEEATLHPRLHWHDGVLQFENGADISGLHVDRLHRCWDEHSLFFGGVHSIARHHNGLLEAMGDPRRYGVGKVLT